MTNVLCWLPTTEMDPRYYMTGYKWSEFSVLWISSQLWVEYELKTEQRLDRHNILLKKRYYWGLSECASKPTPWDTSCEIEKEMRRPTSDILGNYQFVRRWQKASKTKCRSFLFGNSSKMVYWWSAYNTASLRIRKIQLFSLNKPGC